MQNMISIPLDLPNTVVKSTEVCSDGTILIRVENTEEGVVCPKCGKHITKLYGHAPERKVRHISALGAEVYISFAPLRFQCDALNCESKPTTSQRFSWIDPGSSYSVPFEKNILLQLVNSTIKDVCIKENIGYDAVEGILDRHIDTKVNWDNINSLPILGVDEFSVKKGHKDFYTIVSTQINNKPVVLTILKDRKKDTVKKFFMSIPNRLRKTVRVVCSDLYDGFVNAAKEVFGKKFRVTADRFHIAKIYRGCVDTLRKSELRRLKKELKPDEYKKLSGIMWILRKNPDDIKHKDKEKLALLFKYSPDIELAYILCNEMTDIFNLHIPRHEARRKIITWKKKVIKSDSDCFNKFLKTLEKYENEILNYFNGRHSSGFVEGLNNKVKVLKRRCYGLLNLNRWFQRLHLDLTGYELFG